MRYLVNKNILSTDENTIIASKTDNADLNGIVSPALKYIPSSLPAEKRTENYGLRYTIRSNGSEVVMIISNPLNIAFSDTLDFTKFSNQIIRNSNKVQFLFEDSTEYVTSSTYKTNRNSTVNLNALTVGKYRTQKFNGILPITFGPMDVHVILFSGNTGWKENVCSSLQNKVLPYSPLKYGKGQLFYVDLNGNINSISGIKNSINNNYSDICISSSLNPKVRSTGGFELVPSNNNEIYYVGGDNNIYRMSNNGTSWSNQKLSTIALNVANYSELQYSSGSLFYIRNDGIIHYLSNSNGTWVSNWLNGNAKKANPNCGFEVVAPANTEVYYVGDNDSKIYRMFWSSTTGWTSECISPYTLNVREHSEIHYGNGQIFYVRNDGVIHTLYKSNGTWVSNWLNGNAPKVKSGTGFVLLPEQNNLIYYIGEDSFIYKMEWTASAGWSSTKINQTSELLSGAKDNSDILFANDQMFYVGLDSRVHNYSFVYTVPFSKFSSTKNSENNWDVQGSDGADKAFLFYLPTKSTLTATTCDRLTDYDTTLEIFKANGASTTRFNDDDNTCTVGSRFSSVKGVELEAGYYYAVVDGYSGAVGNFNLSVTANSLKSANIIQPALKEFVEKDNLSGDKIENIKIFPNPVSSSFSVISNTLPFNQILLIDLEGRILNQYKGIPLNKIEINCTGIKSGMYLVKVIFDKEVRTYKLVIQH